VSLLGISEAATELGFETIAGKITVDKLSRSPLPCILHWNQNHFVVLYKVRHNKKFYVADPGKGLIKYSREEFSKHWVSTVSDQTLWQRFGQDNRRKSE
jgi:ATP-binding cassette subfamily B protein